MTENVLYGEVEATASVAVTSFAKIFVSIPLQ